MPLLVAVDDAVLELLDEGSPPVPVDEVVELDDVVLALVLEPPAPSLSSSSPRIAAHPGRAAPVSAIPAHFAFSFIAATYQI